MKVTVEQFQIALGVFEDEMLKCIQDKWQRALAAAKIMAYGNGINELVKRASSEGMVDVEQLKGIVGGIMRPCEGEVPLPMEFNVMGFELAKPLEIVIKQADIDRFFEVTLPSVAGQK